MFSKSERDVVLNKAELGSGSAYDYIADKRRRATMKNKDPWAIRQTWPKVASAKS